VECGLRESHPSDTTTVLTMGSRLDEKTSAELHSRLTQLVANNHIRVVVDLRSVRYLDSAGLAALVRGLRMTRERGGWLKLVEADRPEPIGPSPLRSVFDVYRTLKTALASHVPPTQQRGPLGARPSNDVDD
jgi:anti-sigma B factor antagonist